MDPRYKAHGHTYNLEVGDVLSFDWRGVAGAGDYDVMAYIVDESTGHTEELLNATGQGTASSSCTVSKTIEKDGDYRVTRQWCSQRQGSNL